MWSTKVINLSKIKSIVQRISKNLLDIYERSVQKVYYISSNQKEVVLHL